MRFARNDAGNNGNAEYWPFWVCTYWFTKTVPLFLEAFGTSASKEDTSNGMEPKQDI